MARLKAAVLAAFFLVCSTGTAGAYWIWTPRSGKFINPKAAVKQDPKEQFSFALELFEQKQYAEAQREFQKVLKHFPKSLEAAESRYYIGRIYEEESDPYKAFKAYQHVIDTYPFSERIQEIIERQYAIAEGYIAGRYASGLRTALSEDPAIEILEQVIENSSFGPLAPKAQYKLGLVLKSKMRYYEAEDAFGRLLANYPQDELVESAKFQIAQCRAALSRGASYDQGATREAKEKFQEFLKEHPDAELTREAKNNIERLNERQAESSFSVGRFYEKQRQYEAARIYYQDLIAAYPHSPWASQAQERLRHMEADR